ALDGKHVRPDDARIRRTPFSAEGEHQIAVGVKDAHDVALVVGDVDAPVGAEGHAVDPGEISVAPLGDELAILRKNLDRDVRAVDDVDAILAIHHHACYLAKRTV